MLDADSTVSGTSSQMAIVRFSTTPFERTATAIAVCAESRAITAERTTSA